MSMATDDGRVLNLCIKVLPNVRPGMVDLEYAYGTDTGGARRLLQNVAMRPNDDLVAVWRVLRHIRPHAPLLKYMNLSPTIPQP